MSRRIMTQKQSEFLHAPFHRWAIKVGATRSGKTWLDTTYLLPMRIRQCRNREGLVVLIGNTRGTLQRNIIEPMQTLYGTGLVSSINANNTAQLFGQTVYCLGADTKKHVDRLRGSSIQYCYGDEVVTWAQEVFEMLKSRLDKPYSRFDGTCNPENPHHWFKRFLDSDSDIFQQHYCLDDNEFLAPSVRDALKREYAGTVFYDRYVLGHWVAAEGVIYKLFADKPSRYIGTPSDNLMGVWIGIDFGGNGSAHTFTAVGTDRKYNSLYVVDEYYRKEVISPDALEADFCAFIERIKKQYRILGVYADSAEQVLIKGLNAAAFQSKLNVEIVNAKKKPINDRIRFFQRMMGADRFVIAPHCKHTIEALSSAVWDSKHPTQDVRLDDGVQNIDSLDAMEYAVERFMGDFIL